MNRSKGYRWLAWLPAVCIAAAIFWFSSQTAEESTQMSDGVSYLILKLMRGLGFEAFFSLGSMEELAALLSTPVRKAAHMTEYTVFYLSLHLGLYFWDLPKKRRYLYAMAMVFVYASSDEIHQLFVPGRSGQLTDVLIDCTAAALITAAAVWKNREKSS